MALASTAWKEGQSGNPLGRPHGARSPYTKQIIDHIKSLGHKDPLETLSELQHSSQDEGIRATAASMLAPYLHSKLSAIPTPVYINVEVTILVHEDPQDLSQVRANKARIASLLASGLLDLASADKLLAVQNSIAADMIDETKLLAASGGSPEQTIYIEGGLPNLPGTNITMPPPRMNGKDAIEADTAPNGAQTAPNGAPDDQDPGGP
jgi:hypothetical protein